jgi:hypothetical protein
LADLLLSAEQEPTSKAVATIIREQRIDSPLTVVVSVPDKTGGATGSELGSALKRHSFQLKRCPSSSGPQALQPTSPTGAADPLVIADDWGNALRGLLGKGDGTFASVVEYRTWDDVNSFAFGDMNGDGTLDIVAASTVAEVFLGNGDGTFAPGVRYAADTGPTALGDFDGDGRLDVATATYPSSVSVLLNSCR